ncbi:type III-B CRISPR module RAMP protein Cmr6 [bacterium]|nr:type III-B CRISPR module RAMP protein Cmr6 [bacterium]
MDIANNIWNWQGGADELPSYSPNPNPFLSLQEPTFLIGLRLASHCTDQKVLEQVKKWLEAGLQSGIGSQVNTGYGALYAAGAGQPKGEREFFRVDFSLEGQLIHGCQRFTQWNFHERRGWQMRGRAEAEVRPVAFKSMLRYWFRAFALGVLDTNQQVQTWENKLFGGIDPKNYGYLQINILNGKVRQKEPRPNRQGQNDPCGEQQGTLVLSLSSEVPTNQEDAVKQLAQYLTWLMFNLGGIGQGARRPCYSRKTRTRAPWYRGSTFFIESDNKFWDASDSAKQFCQQFQGNLREFYGALATLTDETINPAERRLVPVERSQWAEAVDRHCKILICSGPEKNDKPFALSILHSPQFKKDGDYDGDLCGKVLRGVQPSPVWIADLGEYQVVTIFGANQDPRRQFAQELEQRRSSTFSVFPQ